MLRIPRENDPARQRPKWRAFRRNPGFRFDQGVIIEDPIGIKFSLGNRQTLAFLFR